MPRSGFLCLALAVLLTGAGCKPGRGPAAPPEPAPASWTPERIAADPAGYLAYADKQVQAQIAERARRLEDLAGRRAEIETKGGALANQLEDVRNIRARLQTAQRRAEDEDRWPVKIAGRTFTRDDIQSLLQSTDRFEEDRRPLEQAYAAARLKMERMEGVLRHDIAKLTRMREKVALDLERVRLNQSLAEIGELRKTEEELSALSRSLADLSADSMVDLTLPREEPAKAGADLQGLLRQP